jgi:hypothetical protein
MHGDVSTERMSIASEHKLRVIIMFFFRKRNIRHGLSVTESIATLKIEKTF